MHFIIQSQAIGPDNSVLCLLSLVETCQGLRQSEVVLNTRVLRSFYRTCQRLNQWDLLFSDALPLSCSPFLQFKLIETDMAMLELLTRRTQKIIQSSVVPTFFFCIPTDLLANLLKSLGTCKRRKITSYFFRNSIFSTNTWEYYNCLTVAICHGRVNYLLITKQTC